MVYTASHEPDTTQTPCDECAIDQTAPAVGYPQGTDDDAEHIRHLVDDLTVLRDLKMEVPEETLGWVKGLPRDVLNRLEDDRLIPTPTFGGPKLAHTLLLEFGRYHREVGYGREESLSRLKWVKMHLEQKEFNKRPGMTPKEFKALVEEESGLWYEECDAMNEFIAWWSGTLKLAEHVAGGVMLV